MYHKGEAAKSVRIHQEITSMSIMFVQAGNTSNKVHKDWSRDRHLGITNPEGFES